MQPPTGTPPLHGVCRELLQTKGTVRAKIVAAGVGPSITHELGLGQGRLAPLRKTRLGACAACRTYTSGLNMAKAMGAPRLAGIHPLTQGSSVSVLYFVFEPTRHEVARRRRRGSRGTHLY